ncbi:nuclear transport factor 2 family protein [Stenotrophomonas sp. STM01]|uniref:nuclear transport factor 2 family protein n=1 Tax=Stenotrophomonas sp. STM01 TaxID=2769278 RepID=UPI001CE1C147|nr:nuclear transport factor 2 family protein [Stenotrophomonas sp. STM01]
MRTGAMRVVLLGMLWVTGAASAAPDAATLQAIEATAHDYMDGQLEGDVARVTRALHPDLAKRNVVANPNEALGLGRMSSDELIRYTREGALKTPRDQWQRSITVLAVDEDIATVRLESPWFIDHLQLGRFDGRWVIVNALWHRKKRG